MNLKAFYAAILLVLATVAALILLTRDSLSVAAQPGSPRTPSFWRTAALALGVMLDTGEKR